MRLSTVSFLHASEVFERIGRLVNVDPGIISEEFCDYCDVSYGDATRTLISGSRFSEIVEDIPSLDGIGYTAAFARQLFNVISDGENYHMIDLES